MNTHAPTGAAISLELIEKIVSRRMTKAQKANAQSVVTALAGHGVRGARAAAPARSIPGAAAA